MTNRKLLQNLIYFKNKTFLNEKLSIDDKLDVDHIYPEKHCKNYFNSNESFE